MSYPSYQCHKTKNPPRMDGVLSTEEWQAAEIIDKLVPIAPGQPSYEPQKTIIKMLYDEQALYIGAYLYEQHVWGTIDTDNVPIFMDNDFEVFLDTDGDAKNYYELEVNALGTKWQLSLDKPYSQGGVATDPKMLDGLVCKVNVDGTVNNPSDIDQGWSVTVKIPFESLAQFGAKTPPSPGDTWRVNFSRVQWQHKIVDGKYVRVPPHGTPLPQGRDEWHPEANFVWSPTGIVDIHIPEKWGYVTFME